MKEVHIKKNEDYADSNNPFSNFDVSEYIISLFSNNRDKTFAWPVGTKLARLATLLNKLDNDPSSTPNNESIEDTMIDIANYMLLWKADLKNRTLELKSKIRCKHVVNGELPGFPSVLDIQCLLDEGHPGAHLFS